MKTVIISQVSFILIVSTFLEFTRGWRNDLGLVNVLDNLLPNQSVFKRGNQLSRFPQRKVSTMSLIKQNGYPSEIHQVITEDGYILELHRIPYGLQSPPGEVPKIPVMIQHGSFQSSADWMINSPANNSLPLVLADAGYDVWLGNRRGNIYSNKHIKFPSYSSEFWNHSYHEAALYDFPAVIDYILETTRADKMQYISHSEGAKNFIAGLSMRPEYNDKIGIGITMGPAGFMGHQFNGIARLIMPILSLSNVILNVFGPMPVIPQGISNLLRTTLPTLCDQRKDLIGICSAFFFSILGEDREQISPEKIQAIKSVFPSPMSLKLFVHFVQEIQSGHYRQFDYGENGNMQAYGRSTPPDYDLSKVTVPISIMHGNYDHLAKIQNFT